MIEIYYCSIVAILMTVIRAQNTIEVAKIIDEPALPFNEEFKASKFIHNVGKFTPLASDSSNGDLISLGDGCYDGALSCRVLSDICRNGTDLNYCGGSYNKKVTQLPYPDKGYYCLWDQYWKGAIADPCIPCPSGHYCDGVYGYLITPENDLKFTPGNKIMTGTVNMYQVCCTASIYCCYYSSSLYLQVYYGEFGSEASQMKELINYFTANIGKSDAYTTMTNDIYQIVDNVKTYASNDVRFGGSVSIPADDTIYGGSNSSYPLDFQKLVGDIITSGKLPNDPIHGLYTIIYQGNKLVCIPQFPNQCSDYSFCGFHSPYPIKSLGATYHFSLVGDPKTAVPPQTGCMRQQFRNGKSPNNNLQADNIVKTVYHELVEEVSNYDGTWLWPNSSSIWSEKENADICSQNFEPYLPNTTMANAIVGSKRWLLQLNWVPRYGCATKSPNGTLYKKHGLE